jgi:SH3-like domain-containing protein
MPALLAPRRISSLILMLVALVAPSASLALDYRSVTEAVAVYDAPSAKAKPLFVVLAGTPVELVVSLEGWSKVRDSKGDLTWIEKKYLAEKRNVIVRTERAQVRAAAEDKAALVFEAERDVVLEFLEVQPGGWAKVRHRDGQDGFLKATQVWGL